MTLRLTGRMAVDGTGSNADGVGARVYLRAAGSEVIQVQEVRAGSSYLSMDSIDLEFGLGEAGSAEEVVIYWPSGTVQTVTDLKAGMVHEIVEPAR